MSHRRLARAAALGLTLMAIPAQTAGATPADLRNAGRTSSLAGTTSQTLGQDLRSPDTRDAALAADVGQDLRSPDARDAASGRGTFNAPEVTVVKLSPSAPAEAGGIDWGAAGIGAGSVLALILVGAASTIAVMHRRHDPARQMAATG